jgi:REP element-mobilizing transposase RayT
MGQAAYSLDWDSRVGVLEALKEVCINRGWILLAAHVRTNHVHTIVEAEVQPEKILNDFKVYASRKLNQLGRDQPGQKRWARHGSTRWLWTDQSVREAIKYVVEEQGAPMAVFIAGLI